GAPLEATRTRTLTRTGTAPRRRGCTRSEVEPEKPLPTSAPEVSRPVPGPDGTRSGCSTSVSPAKRSLARPRISSGEKRVHQGAPDAEPLIGRKDADRPHGNDCVGGDGRPARRDVADGPDLFECRERQLGKGVARLPQRLENIDL